MARTERRQKPQRKTKERDLPFGPSPRDDVFKEDEGVVIKVDFFDRRKVKKK